MKRRLKFFAFSSLCLVVILGFGVSKCFCESSIEDLRKAAEQGDAKAQFNLGLSYYRGEGLPQNFADADAQLALGEAAKWFRKAAEQDYAEAQFYLGLMYGTGIGVTKNAAEAVKWLRKVAEQGKADAQYALGWIYASGEGIEKNAAEGVKWYRKAAEQGLASAQFSLGMAYAKGEGAAKDSIEAVKWYRKAAEQEFARAQLNLGMAYENGDGVPKDYIEALAWYNIAAASGNNFAPICRDVLEKQLGSQVTLTYQQRSKEILKEIEFAKQTKTKTDPTGQGQPQKSGGIEELKGSGTGVFVTSDGLILTAAHVVGKSASLKVLTKQGLKVAWVVKLDASNDLALLKCDGNSQAVPVKSSSGIKLGRSVFTIGFPNIGFQGFSPKMTKGEISSLSGLQDDPRHWQISVPVQPGNSGGPLFDEAGNVVGVVLSKLDAIKVAKFTGDLPQNVNYAVKSIYALPLLEQYAGNLAPETGASASPKMLENIVEKVQGSVVLILVY